MQGMKPNKSIGINGAVSETVFRFEETSEWSTACRGVNCVGGISRVLTVVRQLLKERPDSISLNAGDNYQGTLWYTLFNYNVTQHFLNIIPTDAYVSNIFNYEYL